MTPDQFRRLEALFEAAGALGPAKHAAVLEKARVEDPDIARELEALLLHDRRPHAALERPAVGASQFEAAFAEARTRPFPERIGRYRIQDVLGEGGMGIVYLAEQDEPHRTVAVKVLRSSSPSDALVRRFHREVEALGRLHHPGIAQIFEAGSAETRHGLQPYLAMEHIRGRSIVAHARQRALGTRERLRLLARVCEAVQHAHEHGIVHRDLKPGNVFVDESGQPKILDFGIARLSDPEAGAPSLRTLTGELIGTVAYMSPEQLSGDPGEIDLRSDVYALGVIGYELLTDRLPLDVADKPLAEAARIVRDEDPRPLSTANRRFRGDLETIIGKAIEKEKAHRYGSAAELGADLERYLSDQPIAARPPSTWYQLGKFARRNRILVGSAAAVFVSLVAGVVVSLAFLAQARTESNLKQEQIAVAKTNLGRALKAEEESRREADVAREVADFLVELFAVSNPSESRGNTITAREILDRGAERIRGGPDSMNPEIRARLMQTMGQVYQSLGLYDAAGSLLEEALETRRQHLENDSPETASNLKDLGWLQYRKGDRPKAEALLRESVDLFRRLGGADVDDFAVALSHLGWLTTLRADFEPAEALIRASREMRRRLHGDHHSSVAKSRSTLANVLYFKGDYDGAESIYRESLALVRDQLGPDHPEVAALLHNAGLIMVKKRDDREAEKYLRQAVELNRRVLGRQLHVSSSVSDLGFVLLRMRRQGEAEALFREALELGGTDSPKIGLGLICLNRGDPSAAEAPLREALDVRRKSFGDQDSRTLEAATTLGQCLILLSRHDEARTHFHNWLQVAERAHGAESPYVTAPASGLGLAFCRGGRAAEAEPHLRRAIDARRKSSAKPEPATGVILSRLGECLESLGRLDEAEPLLLEGQAILEGSATGDQIFEEVEALERLVRHFESQGQPERAAEFRSKVAAAKEVGSR